MATGNGSKQLRRYTVRSTKSTRFSRIGDFLAEIVISDDGYFSTVSEWGNYAHWWAHVVGDFRAFLSRINNDQLISRIAPFHEYDGKATLAEVRKYICAHRRTRNISREAAREEWSLLAENGDIFAREDFALWHRDTKIEEVEDFWCESRPAQAIYFVNNVWPEFATLLVAELAADRVVTALPVAAATVTS